MVEGRLTPRVGGKQSQGGRSSVEKKAMGGDDWRAGLSLSHWDRPAQTHHVQTEPHSAFPHSKRNWKSECCATFLVIERCMENKIPCAGGFAQ